MTQNFTLIENVLSEIDIQKFTEQVDWKQNEIKVFGKTFLEPRLTQWFGPAYSYSSISWHERTMPDFMMPFLRKAEEICDYKFNAVLLNLYRNGQDSMGWHADNEPEIDQACIASINIGASRKFKIRKTKDHSEKADFILTHGSLLIMKDAQKDWQHSVPKTKKNIGPRINMTFRRIIS